MESHLDLSDTEFERQFESCQLNPGIFSHEAHLRLAWIHLRNYGLDETIDNLNRQLIAYTDSLGARDKYNKTLTIAAIKAVYHFMNKSKTDTFSDFIQQFPRLKFAFKELMAQHYQLDIYTNDLAKKTYLEPDLLPFE
ncbi:hypothetical protein GCM10028805_23850 [Spirosoma harenae]